MFDVAFNAQGSAKIKPSQVVLDNHRAASRSYDEAPRSGSETKRRRNVDVASARLALICQQDGDKWREVSLHELLESLRADIQASRDEIKHQRAQNRERTRKIAKSPGRKALRLVGMGKGKIYLEPPKTRDVPFVTDTEAQLEDGLRILVETGCITVVGAGETALYAVSPRFFVGLKHYTGEQSVTEP